MVFRGTFPPLSSVASVTSWTRTCINSPRGISDQITLAEVGLMILPQMRNRVIEHVVFKHQGQWNNSGRARVSCLVVFWWTRKPLVSSSFHVALSPVPCRPNNCRHMSGPRAVRSVGRFNHMRLCIWGAGSVLRGSSWPTGWGSMKYSCCGMETSWEVLKGGRHPLACSVDGTW